jgi:molybdopterin converting factor small subunit
MFDFEPAKLSEKWWVFVLKEDWFILKVDLWSRFSATNIHPDKEGPTMKVTLKCFAKLSEGDVCDFTGSSEQEISEGETVGNLISRLGFSHEEVKVIFLNGRIVDFDAVLGDGDQVGLAPPQLGF